MRRLPVLIALALAGCGGDDVLTAAGDTPPGGSSPAGAVQPAPAPGRPADAAVDSPARGRWALARVTRATAVRTAPGGRVLARIGRRTEFGSARWVGVVGRRGAWLRVLVPELSNHRRGWIRAAATRRARTDLSLHVDRSARTLAVRAGGRALRRVRIGVGAPGHPTPTGRFAVTDKLLMGGPGTTYGCCAVALSAHQPHLPPGWPGLDRVAVHGTQSPATIGRAASLGCMHAGERDLRWLMRVVPLGAPVFIRA